LERRLSAAPAKYFGEVGGVRKSGPPTDFPGGHTIEQWRLKHADRNVDARLKQHRAEGFAASCKHSVQRSRRDVERTCDVGCLQGSFRAALHDLIMNVVAH
jgi:2-polyprenyl-3-methyl-5-hydroxy-6-metoxy-1,4-benzoquinol methylase